MALRSLILQNRRSAKNVVDHAGSEVHKATMLLKRAESAKACSTYRLQSVYSRFYHASNNGDACFMVAEEIIAFAKYPS